MDRIPSSQSITNERRNYFRLEDKVLLRYQIIDETTALANIAPKQFRADQANSLMRDLQHIDQESNKYLHSIAEINPDLELYLKALSKKIDTIASSLVDHNSLSSNQLPQVISLSEGGLAFPSPVEHAHDSYLALQLTLLPQQLSLVLFAKVINCSTVNQPRTGEDHTRQDNPDNFTIAVSFVHLKESDRQIIAKHIMQLQLSARRSNKQDG